MISVEGHAGLYGIIVGVIASCLACVFWIISTHSVAAKTVSVILICFLLLVLWFVFKEEGHLFKEDILGVKNAVKYKWKARKASILKLAPLYINDNDERVRSIAKSTLEKGI